MATRILHTNKKRDVILSSLGTEEPVIIKVSNIERLLESEWIIGRKLIEKIEKIPNPLGEESIISHFSCPITFEKSSESEWKLTTSYLQGETLWTEISKGLSSSDAWKIVIMALMLLEQLRRYNVNFSHNDLHVGNISVIKLSTPRLIKSPFAECPFEFSTNYIPGIFDYDVSFIEGVSVPNGYHIETKRLERGLVPCVYDPLFDAMTLSASTLYSLHVGQEFEEFAHGIEATSLATWMKRNGFTLKNRGYTYLDIPKLPWMKSDVYSNVKSLFSLEDNVSGAHSAWCQLVAKRKRDSLKNRRDKDLCSIIGQLSMFI